jgi:hypothetical protein
MDYVIAYSLLRSNIFRTQVLTATSLRAMKLDASDLRYVTSEEFRVLTAVG